MYFRLVSQHLQSDDDNQVIINWDCVTSNRTIFIYLFIYSVDRKLFTSLL